MPSQKQMIEETYRGMNEIKTLLLGAKNSSDCGLVGEVQQVRKDFYSFRNKCLIIFGIFTGGGALGTGIWELIKWLG